MSEKGFAKFMGLYPKAIQHYCDTLGWDLERFKTSISDEGISHPDLYIEDPNIGIIDKISQFLEPTNQSSVFIIYDDVGMGKSSIRDFVSKSLNGFDNYHVVVLSDPRLSSLQILRLIAGEIGAEPELPNDRGSIKEALWKRLEDITEHRLNLIIWLDEAEKITREIISELRALSDLKTSDGTKMIKLVLSGTPGLMKKIEDYIKKDPEDAAAFDDRASLNTFSLHKWKEIDIYNYWKLLADYCGDKNPFTKDAARTVFRISEGKPRTIAQVTKLAFYAKAVEHLDEDGDIDITSEHVLTALKDTLSGKNA